jgi:hypothetical protein
VRLLPLTLAAALLMPQAAAAAPPAAPSAAPSERGTLEFGLGAVMTGTAGGLIGFGVVQLIRAREHVEFCRRSAMVISEDEPGGINPCVFDPPALGFASAGLAWGFSIPLLVGAGLLFVRATKLLRDARRFDGARLSGAPWAGRRGAGVGLGWRF